MIVRVLFAALISLMAMQNASAAPVTLRESHDCPIAVPFEPLQNTQTATTKQDFFYSLQGYNISRIQISADHPVHLKIIWTPVDAMWGVQSAQISFNSTNAQCFLSSFPFNTPAKQIEIRSSEPVEKLVVSFSDVPWDHEGECPAKKRCPVLLKSMKECKARPDSKVCDDFIGNLHNLTQRAQCRRPIDPDPVPAIWLCDTKGDVVESAMRLLKSLKSKKAVDYYKSEEFRSVLDGGLADEYYDGL